MFVVVWTSRDTCSCSCVQEVMVVGEPTLMGGEFGDEDERLITRLENAQFEQQQQGQPQQQAADDELNQSNLSGVSAGGVGVSGELLSVSTCSSFFTLSSIKPLEKAPTNAWFLVRFAAHMRRWNSCCS